MAQRVKDKATDSGGSVARPRHRKRRLRWVVRALLALVILVGGGVILLTQTPLMKSMVLGRVDGLLGVHSSAGRVTLARGGVLVIDDLRVRTEVLQGPGGEVLRAQEAHVDLDWSNVWRGKVSVKAVRLIKPRMRVSVSEKGSLNMGLLRRPAQRGRAGRFPALDIVDGVVEVGEHRGETYQSRAEIHVRGGLYQRPNDPSVYDIDLSEPEAAQGSTGKLVLSGELNADTGQIDVTMQGIDLSEWSGRTAPGPYRNLWAAMDVRGEIDQVHFAYTPGSSVEASLALRSVSMNLPVEDAEGHSHLLAMRQVNGPIRFTRGGAEASLHGFVEDVEANVSARYDGVSDDAPFFVRVDAPKFTVEQRSALMALAPDVVREIFDRFSQPSMVLSGWVGVSRGAPDAQGVMAEVVSEGSVQVSEGVARYEEYPYPFEHITGRIEFDAAEVRVIDFRGVAPTGAKLSLSGLVAPPEDEAAVDIRVQVQGMPVDEVLRDSLPAHRKGIIDFLVDTDALAAMYEQGVIVTSADAARDRTALREVEQALADARTAHQSMMEIERLSSEASVLEERTKRGVFDAGGVLDMAIHVHRPEGVGGEFLTDIELRSAALSLVPRAFAYPVVGRDVLVRVDDEAVTIEQSRFDSPTGASGTIRGRVLLTSGAEDVVPELDITALHVPVDDVLLQALPGEGSSATSPAHALRALAVRGAVSANVKVYPEPGDTARTAFDAHVTGQSLAARPMLGGEVLALDDVRLDMNVQRDAVHVHDVSASIGEAAVSGHGEVALDDDGKAQTIDIGLQAKGLELAQPIEAAVAAFAPEAAAQIAKTREQHMPAGCADIDAQLSMVGDLLDYRVQFAQLQDVALTSWGGRLALHGTMGAVDVMPRRAHFAALDGDVSFDDVPCGRVALKGDVYLDAGGIESAGAVEGGPLELSIGIAGGAIGSPLVRAVAQSTSPEFAKWMDGNALGGQFAAQVVMTSRTDGDRSVTGMIQPKALAMDSGGERLSLPEMTGSIEISPTGGDIRLEGSGDGVALVVDGAWARDDEAPFAFQGRVDAQAPSFSPGLRAALPSGLKSAFEGIGLEVRGPVAIRGGELRVDWPDAETGERVSGFAGDVVVANLQLDPGLAIKQADGVAQVSAWQRSGEAASDVTIAFGLSSARVSAIAVNNVEGRITSTPDPGGYVIQIPTGAMYDGRLAVSGAVHGLGGVSASGGPGEWEMHASFDRVDFRAMLKDLMRDKQGAEATDVPGRGELFADLSVRGRIGTSDRQGRGLMRLQSPDNKLDTQVLELPGLVRLVKLSSLQVPVGEPVTFAYAEWYLEGSRMVFEELTAESASVAVVGAGQMSVPGLDLDMTFTTRSLVQTPLLTELTEMLRNEVVTAKVSGNLYDPKVKYEQLQATRSLLDAIVTGDARRRDRVGSAPRQAAADNAGERNE
ncbi:MAG: hypothetical protein KDA20_12200 [Phycisphaerales bacterium]|nr:hypothetical protein [Phycisphaerales bacterium]